MSLPTRERGLKYVLLSLDTIIISVAPYAGAWIEIPQGIKGNQLRPVAPYAGAWIEIANTCSSVYPIRSLPTRERGLKWLSIITYIKCFRVAPYAGAWIEIPRPLTLGKK